MEGPEGAGKVRAGGDVGTCSAVCDVLAHHPPGLRMHRARRLLSSLTPERDVTQKGGRKALACFLNGERYPTPAGPAAQSHTGSLWPSREVNPGLPEGSSSA